MNQSVITPDTLGILVARAENVVGRKLTDLEQTLMEYAVEQVRLGLVEVE
jgi:hypothetical protein